MLEDVPDLDTIIEDVADDVNEDAPTEEPSVEEPAEAVALSDDGRLLRMPAFDSFDPVTGIPCRSAIPVSVQRVEGV